MRDTNNEIGPHRGVRDRGQSLIEAVITITIVAIVLVPVLSAVIQNIRASAGQRSSSLVDVVMENAADRINRAPQVCDYTIYAQAAAQSQGWTADRATVVQKHFVPGADPTQQGTWAVGACVAGVPKPAELAVQLVEITIVSPDGSNRGTIQVVKSDV